jgi:1,4-alpha-glucan branching enzyme
LYRDLNKAYRKYPALYELDHNNEGFEWIDHGNADQSILSVLRKSTDAKQKIYVLVNFTPKPYESFKLGVQDEGTYQLILNSDDKKYWGSAFKTPKKMQAVLEPWNEQPYSINVNLPPLASLFILFKG